MEQASRAPPGMTAPVVSQVPGIQDWFGPPKDERVVNVLHGKPDCDNIVTTVYYTMNEQVDPTIVNKTVVRAQLQYRPRSTLNEIAARKTLTRFGAATGAQGPERGTTMIAPDDFMIEDPTSLEAQQTGEEKMIERLKYQVEHRTRSPVPNSSYRESSMGRSNEASPARSRGNQQRRGYGNNSFQNRSKTPPTGGFRNASTTSPARYRDSTPPNRRGSGVAHSDTNSRQRSTRQQQHRQQN